MQDAIILSQVFLQEFARFFSLRTLKGSRCSPLCLPCHLSAANKTIEDPGLLSHFQEPRGTKSQSLGQSLHLPFSQSNEPIFSAERPAATVHAGSSEAPFALTASIFAIFTQPAAKLAKWIHAFFVSRASQETPGRMPASPCGIGLRQMQAVGYVHLPPPARNVQNLPGHTQLVDPCANLC